MHVFGCDQVLFKNPGTHRIKSHAFDSKKLAVKSKYAFFFSSVADPGVLALLPCPPPYLPLITIPDHRSVQFFHQFQGFETEIAQQNNHIQHASDSF